MNSQLWWSLEIKEKEWRQLLIIRDAKWNKITRVTKETKKNKHEHHWSSKTNSVQWNENVKTQNYAKNELTMMT